MECPASHYLYWTGSGLRIVGTRVSLDVILIDFLRLGRTAAQIAEALPTVPLSHIYGAIAYYYEHQGLMDEYLAEGDRKIEELKASPFYGHELHAKLEEARRRLVPKSA